MKKSKLLKIGGCIILVLFILFVKNGHIHFPGHGNIENKNLEESVVNHVSSTLADGEEVEFVSKYLCEDYMENDEVRFSANVIYNIISKNGLKERHSAHVICNEDKDKIIEWKDL
jgi:hypothetical protein